MGSLHKMLGWGYKWSVLGQISKRGHKISDLFYFDFVLFCLLLCWHCHENRGLTYPYKTDLYGEECLLFINYSHESYLSDVGLNPTECWPLTDMISCMHSKDFISFLIKSKNNIVYVWIYNEFDWIIVHNCVFFKSIA